MIPTEPAMLEEVKKRLRYYRDLGVYDLYRRGEPQEAEFVAAVEARAEEVKVVDTVTVPIQSTSTQAISIQSTLVEPAATGAEAEDLPEYSQEREDSELAPRTPKVYAQQPPPMAKPIAASKRAAALVTLREEIGECTRCTLAEGRNQIVFGDGDPNTRILFVGEGPGADEDEQGLPFVGRAGQLLNNMIVAMGLARSEVYIANIVKCRPPKNRVPEPEEANTCMPFLFRQIDIIRPEIIVALGATAATYLMGGKQALRELRGKVHEALGTKLIVTYHPAYLLRDPNQKKEAWADLQIAMRELGLKPKKPASKPSGS